MRLNLNLGLFVRLQGQPVWQRPHRQMRLMILFNPDPDVAGTAIAATAATFA